MKNFWKAFGFLAMIAVIYMGVNILAVLIIGAIVVIQNPSMMEGGLVSTETLIVDKVAEYALPITIIGDFLTLAIIMLIFLARKDKFLTYVGFKKVKWSDLGLVMIFGVFLNAVISPLVSIAMTYIPSSMAQSYTDTMDIIIGGSSVILIIFTTSIVAPLFEEIVVRGVILNDFKKAVPLWLAIIIQAILFGLMHGNIVQGTYAFVIGVIFGIIYHKYKSIWVPIGMHFAFNSTSILVGSIIGENESTLSYLVQMIVGLLGCGFILYMMKRRYVSADYEEVTDGGIIVEEL